MHMNLEDTSFGNSQQVKIGNYIIGETIGSGTFGKVKIGIHSYTNVKVAVKIVNRKKIKELDVAGKLKREIQNLWLFTHPHIIKLYQVISTPTDIFLFMEYVSGGELFDFIVEKGKLKEPESRRFFQQIISGVDYCHRHMVVHRDLKPENLLLDHNNNVKIADFGLSNIMADGEFMRTSCGSPNYAAPEVISGKLYAGPEVDIWSCGVILYALTVGSLPFDDENISVLFRKIRSGVFHLPSYLSADLCDLLNHMLQVDPVVRMTVTEIRQHVWFKENLPDYLFPVNNDEDASIVDKDALRELCRLTNVSEHDALNTLVTGDQSDHFCVAYRLIIDNRTFGGHSSLDPNEFNEFFAAEQQQSNQAQNPCGNSCFYSDSTFTPGGNIIFPSGACDFTSPGSLLKYSHPERMPDGLHLTRTLDPILATGTSSSTHQLKKYKWHLGIRSQSRPQDIMREVFRALHAAGPGVYEWKIINTYNARIRKWNAIKSHYVKLMLQLYQVDTRNYLLDFTLIEDPSTLLRNNNTSLNQTCQNNNMNESQSSSTLNTSNANSSPPDFGSIHQTMEFFELCAEIIVTLSR